jgi:hypothetical protein
VHTLNGRLTRTAHKITRAPYLPRVFFLSLFLSVPCDPFSLLLLLLLLLLWWCGGVRRSPAF